MFPRVALLSGMLLAGCVALAACGGRAGTRVPTVALVEAAPASGYGAFNGKAKSGLLACRRATGATIVAVAPASVADYERQIVLLATENTDAIIGIGFSMAPDIARLARRFEVTHFAIVDATVAAPNVNSITFNMAEGSFLAGALAAMVSRTHGVAFLGGRDVTPLQQSEAGFTAGVREIDPRVHVRVRYVGSFDDPAAAKSAAASLFATGTDIVYVNAGASGLGAIAAAKGRRDAFVIGSDSDQDGLAPGKVLTSVVKRVDAAALRVCLETFAQKPASGETVLGLADGGIALTSFAYTKAYVGAARLARLERIRRALALGTLKAPATRAALAAFRPVALP